MQLLIFTIFFIIYNVSIIGFQVHTFDHGDPVSFRVLWLNMKCEMSQNTENRKSWKFWIVMHVINLFKIFFLFLLEVLRFELGYSHAEQHSQALVTQWGMRSFPWELVRCPLHMWIQTLPVYFPYIATSFDTSPYSNSDKEKEKINAHCTFYIWHNVINKK